MHKKERAPTRSRRPAASCKPTKQRPGFRRTFRFCRAGPDQRMVGMTNSAPSLMPLGQRDVMVLVLV